MCSSDYIPVDNEWSVFYAVYYALGGILPVGVIVYATVRICIVVLRTHRQISAQAQSIVMGSEAVGNPGFVTAQAIRSSRNVLVICSVSFIMNTPIFIFALSRYLTGYEISHPVPCISLWIFESNTFVNGLLYLLMYQSVRQKAVHILYVIFRHICHA